MVSGQVLSHNSSFLMLYFSLESHLVKGKVSFTFEFVKWSPQNASHDPFIGSLVFKAHTCLKQTFKTYYLDVVMLILPKPSICYLSLYLDVSFSADEINYKIRFPTKAWTDDLSNQESESRRKFINEIKEKVSVVDDGVAWVVASLVSQVLSLLQRIT